MDQGETRETVEVSFFGKGEKEQLWTRYRPLGCLSADARLADAAGGGGLGGAPGLRPEWIWFYRFDED